MEGTGGRPLPAALRSIVANPVGGAGFGAGGGYAARAFGSTRSTARELLPDGGQTVVFTATNVSPGDLSEDMVRSISGDQLRSVLGSLSGVDFDRIAVGVGSAGPIELFNGSIVPAPGTVLLPIRRVDKDGDGVFDVEDRIEFFASGPSRWRRDPDDSMLGDGIRSLQVHPWDLARRYLVRLDAPEGSPDLPVGATPGAPARWTSTLRPAWAGRHVQVRSNGLRGEGGDHPDFQSGTNWFWHWTENKTLDSSALYHPASATLPGLMGSNGRVVVRFAGVTSKSPNSGDSLVLARGRSEFEVSAGTKAVWKVAGLESSGNGWSWQGRVAGQDFESYTIHGSHQPSKTTLVPFPAPTPGAFSLPVTGATSSDSVIAVENGVGARIVALVGGSLVDSARTDNTWYFPSVSTPVDGSSLARWRPSSASSALDPSGMLGDVSAELVIVAPDSFVDLAEEHARFRADARRIRPMQTKIVRADDLWLLWGHGSRDPLAIRDMLRYARDRWGTTHVLLLGGGHYDPRALKGGAPAPIPVWEDYAPVESRLGTDDRTASLDGILTYLEPGNPSDGYASVAIGRLPGRTRGEISATLAKIRLWEDPARASAGPWRNTFLLTADDMVVREDGGSPDDYQGSSGHTEMSETVGDAIRSARPWAQFRKVYEVEYPMNAVLEKPDAQRALLDGLNRGVAVMQYFGHGGSDILADERLLDTRSALDGLSNSRTPFLFLAGSCTVGRHDMGASRGLAEALVAAENKGAVASIAATRPSYGTTNREFLKDFWLDLLPRKTDGRSSTLGEAMRDARNIQTKGRGFYDDNLYFDLLGDPAMVPFPAGSPLSLENAPDTLSALDSRHLNGVAESEVQVNLLAHPVTRVATYRHSGVDYAQSYVLPGRTLVSVRSKANNGRYDARLLTPSRIPFGDTAAILVYGWNPSNLRDSAILDTEVVLSGVGANTSTDGAGPRIRVFPCDSSWSAGQPFGRTVEVPVPFCMNIFLDDSSGISASDGPDEGVILSVPGTLQPWHPTEIGEGKDYTQAWARLSLDAETFKPGRTYPLQIFARDLMGNASSASLEIHTRSSSEIGLYEVFNRPNPAKGSSTTFYFKLLTDADSNGVVPSTVQASIRIHTISGKLVRILRTDLSQVGRPRPCAVWDLKDAFRNDVANGMYPYTAILRVKDAEGRNWRQMERKGIIAVSR